MCLLQRGGREEEVNSVFCELNVLQSISPAEPSDLALSQDSEVGR